MRKYFTNYIQRRFKFWSLGKLYDAIYLHKYPDGHFVAAR